GRGATRPVTLVAACPLAAHGPLADFPALLLRPQHPESGQELLVLGGGVRGGVLRVVEGDPEGAQVAGRADAEQDVAGEAVEVEHEDSVELPVACCTQEPVPLGAGCVRAGFATLDELADGFPAASLDLG